MITKIVVNENCSSWELDFEYNKLFAMSQLMYIRDLYIVRGYIYLNQIYEAFELVWNPYNENISWIYGRDGDLDWSIQYDEQSHSQIIIEILCNSK